MAFGLQSGDSLFVERCYGFEKPSVNNASPLAFGLLGKALQISLVDLISRELSWGFGSTCGPWPHGLGPVRCGRVDRVFPALSKVRRINSSSETLSAEARRAIEASEGDFSP